VDQHHPPAWSAVPGTRGISRRSLLKGTAAAGLVAAGGYLAGRAGITHADSAGKAAAFDWPHFDAAVQAAMQTFDMVGAAVAVVNRQGIVHSNTFGVRDLASGAPVTPNTLFHVGSLTKSMTSLLVATLVDEGTLAWDQPVTEVWPDFRAPTDELTQALRVRDLLGMDSGLGAPDSADYQQGYPTALELLHSITFLPVLGPPHTTFFYNNPVYATGGYLALLAQGRDPGALLGDYVQLMQQRVFGPAGMATARIADDSRPFTDDYATGYALDFVEGTAREPQVPVGSFAPVGGTLASLTDMAAYLRTQLLHGVSPSGTRVVSDANLTETWKPHIDQPIFPEVDPDLVSAGYAMGWIAQTYTDGRRLISHTGGVDGFTSYSGFFPDDDLGLVILMNTWTTPGALAFYPYVQNLLLSGRFGLNVGVNDTLVSLYQAIAQQLQDQADQAGPVDPAAIAPYLGYYEHGYRLAFDAASVLRIRQSARATRLLAMPDGSYIAGSGILAGSAVHFSRDSSGNPQMAITGAETVRWQSGLE
jgi:CubicO group peptidase (beta-lactamase class C family)